MKEITRRKDGKNDTDEGFKQVRELVTNRLS